MNEWYPRECEYCTREAALSCTDPTCRARGYGHTNTCPTVHTRNTQDCVCVKTTP